MRALSVELEDEIVDALEAERELFGFESRQAYVRWIIEHRGSIEAGQGDDHEGTQDRLLAEHSERLARLEERVGAVSRTVDSGGGNRPRIGDGTETARSSPESAAGAGESGRTAAASDSQDDQRDAPEAERSGTREPALEVRGSPRTVRHGPDSKAESDDGETHSSSATREHEGARPKADSDDEGPDSETEMKTETEPESAADPSPTLSPERVARIPEDPVLEDAGVLGTVETERLDELSRRAVATTRKRLDRDVQTGLEYASSTRLAGSDVRPGEDITDLEALSVPGRSAETVEARRHAVGRALAYVRDEGRARRSDFVGALYAEYPAGYETEDGWWRCLKQGLKQVDAVDGGEGTRVWTYRG